MEEKEEENEFKAREYQQELFNIAKDKNSILVLGTGSGKTYISILNILHHADKIRGKFSEGAQRSVFVVNSVPLVRQQAEAIKMHTPFKVGFYDGSMNVDFWNKEKWDEELEDNQVIVIIDAIFRDIVLHKYLSLDQVNLLILDECHHTTGSSPMNEFMREYQKLHATAKHTCPRIMGMTACAIQKKCKPTISAVEKLCRELENSLDSTLVTSYDQQTVSKYATKAKESIRTFESSSFAPSEFQKKISSQLDDITNYIYMKDDLDTKGKKAANKIIKSIDNVMDDLGEWCTKKAIEYEIEDLEKKIDREDVPIWRTLLSDIKVKLEKIHDSFPVEYVVRQNELKPSVIELLNILKDYGNENFACLIFVEKRNVAKLLYALLLSISNSDNELVYVKPGYVIGANNNPDADIRLAEEEMKRMQKTIKEFRKGERNVIVSTSVLEEGVDIRKCNLVIRFDMPQTYRGYVQSRGRARAEVSNYILMCQENNRRAVENDIRDYKTIEKILQERCHGREDPTDFDVRQHFSRTVNILPYMPYGTLGPKVTENSAVQLINRYCGSLPQDKFSNLCPEIKEKKNRDEIIVSITLPKANAPLKSTIKGNPMPNKDLAKKSAAMELCKKLHEIGELDEHLFPTVKSPEDILKGLVDLPEEVIEPGAPQPGTRKRKQIYQMQVCDGFKNTWVRKPFKLFAINIISDNSTDEFVDINTTKPITSLGFISQNDIVSSPIQLFSPKFGKLDVNITCVKDGLNINEENLKLIQNFHSIVFQTLINLSTYMFESDKEKGILIVPLVHSCDLDLETLDLAAKSLWKEVQSNKSYNDLFIGSIVKGWYKEDKTMYFVQNLKENMSPLSEFPKSKKEYKTFSDYYEKEYNVKIVNLNQPLLECRGVPKEINYLDERHLRSKKQKSDPPMLVPELVNILVLPASLWRQVMCIPSILHALNNLNIAHELCCKIASIPIENVNAIKNEYLDRKWSENKVQSALKRCDNICVALSAKGDSALNPKMLIQALTLASSNKDYNLEQLEVLGDSFLKYACCEFLFMKYSNEHEGNLTIRKNLLVSNHTLYGRAKSLNLPEYLQSLPLNPQKHGLLPGFFVKTDLCQELCTQGLSPELWPQINEKEPDNIEEAVVKLMEEKKEQETENALKMKNLSKETVDDSKLNDLLAKIDLSHKQQEVYNPWTHHKLSDKSIADSVEALIGVHLLVGGSDAAIKFLNWLGIGFHQTLENERKILQDAIISSEPWARDEVMRLYKNRCLDDLESIIQYEFKEKSFLVQAATHSSFVQNKVTECYQRLEFLGDSVLDYLITGHIYAHLKNCTPGQMTDLRSHFVNNSSLANISAKLNLQRYLLYSSCKLQNTISRFIEASQDMSEGYDLELNTEDDTEDVDDVDVPKALGDFVEAIIGAVYIDSGKSLKETWKVIKNMFGETLDDISPDKIPINYIRKLYEQYPGQIDFEKIERREKDEKAQIKLQVNGIGVFIGSGKNYRLAKQNAVKRALGT